MASKRIFQEAENLFNCKKFDEAEKKYTEFIQMLQPKSSSQSDCDQHQALRHGDTRSKYQLTQAFNNRGQIKYLKVDFDEAIDDYTAALKVDSDFAIGYYNRGQIHYRLGRFTESIEDFNKALSLQPKFQDAVLALKTATEDKDAENR